MGNSKIPKLCEPEPSRQSGVALWKKEQIDLAEDGAFALG